MTIRKFRKEDAKHCSRIGKRNFMERIYAKAEDGYLKNKWQWFRYLSSKKITKLAMTSRHIRVAVDENEQVVGFGSYELTDKGAEIAMMFVEIEKHGQKIGKKILESMLKEIKERGIRKVYLYSLLNVSEFYSKYGFIHDHSKDEKRKPRWFKPSPVHLELAKKHKVDTLDEEMGYRYGYYMYKIYE